MIFEEVPLKGAYIIDLKPIADDRGFFARGFCMKEFEDQGLVNKVVQQNLGFSERAGTLRGMHYQRSPYQEVKIVRCTQGEIYDVIVDMREDSPTYKQWYGVELTANNHRALYVPEGFAHGYQTLTDKAEMYYFTSQFYASDHATGVQYNDPAFGIDWPMAVTEISEADSNWSRL